MAQVYLSETPFHGNSPLNTVLQMTNENEPGSGRAMEVKNDKAVTINLSSKDVIRSFGVPQMRVKQDVNEWPEKMASGAC